MNVNSQNINVIISFIMDIDRVNLRELLWNFLAHEKANYERRKGKRLLLKYSGLTYKGQVYDMSRLKGQGYISDAVLPIVITPEEDMEAFAIRYHNFFRERALIDQYLRKYLLINPCLSEAYLVLPKGLHKKFQTKPNYLQDLEFIEENRKTYDLIELILMRNELFGDI